MIAMFLGLTGRRLLPPLERRHPAEARSGGMLPDSQRYLQREDRRQIERLARNLRDVNGVAGELADEKRLFADQEAAMRAAVVAEVRALDPQFKFPSPARWFASIDLVDWVRSAVESGVERGLYGPESVDAVTTSATPRSSRSWQHG